MKKICLIAVAIIVGACLALVALDVDSDTFITAQLGDNRYSVIYVEKDKVLRELSRKHAMVKAAQMTQDASARYFVVDSEEKLMLLYTPANEGADAYQEVARSKNTPLPQDAILFPALKLTFRIFQDQHEKDAVDSCKYVKCPDVK